MDDLNSAIYYSAWNQCIAEAMRRFPIDLYHINDYHGTVAPLYLLPVRIVGTNGRDLPMAVPELSKLSMLQLQLITAANHYSS